MRDNRERLAWVILLTSFFTCLGLVFAVPLGVRHYILHSRVPQSVTLEVQQGPLRVTLAGRGAPVAIDRDRGDIPEHTIIATDETAGRLTISTPQTGSVIATVQLYGDTAVALFSARSPRFATSQLPHQVILEVNAGRVRINVSNADDRPTAIEAQTPHGTVTLTEGSYEVKVNGTMTEVIVRAGQANAANTSEQITTLGPAERAIVTQEKITGPLPTARNLVSNGDFQYPLEMEGGWISYGQQTDPEQPSSRRASIVTDSGQEALEFYCDGNNHSEVGIRQEINYDVRDFTSLQLRLNVRIISQNIAGFGGCGYLSTECPVIVRLDYKDIYGNDREWLHGFYTGEPHPDWLVNWWTEQLPSGNWQTFDSDNLMEELKQADTPPALIKAITIYASGHSFHARVTEIELLAQE